jgi:hypothetical protein|tara:strand:- start:568 stop:738 length:171 start_codon:yes stop_codon:yes gene_type:complete
VLVDNNLEDTLQMYKKFLHLQRDAEFDETDNLDFYTAQTKYYKELLNHGVYYAPKF